MRFFSISELERFSDIKAHTIRTWEKRYNLFSPERKKDNTRSYSLSDVSRLLDISLLLSYGDRISRISGMTTEEHTARLTALKSAEARQRLYIGHLIVSMFRNDTDAFEDTLDKAFLAWGADTAIHKIIVPFLSRVQVLSYKDTSIEVHFAVTLVRKKIILGIEKTQPEVQRNYTALLFLPHGEHYDLLLLYINYILKSKGYRVLYLGTNISLDNLKTVTEQKKPDIVVTHVINQQKFPLASYATFLDQCLPLAKLFVLTSADEACVASGHSNIEELKLFSLDESFA